jgi:hypothetical protein
MLFAAAGQTACMIVLAVTVQNGGVSAGKAAASMLFLFNTFFACGWLAMYILIWRSQMLMKRSPWLYPAEVTTLRIRSKGAACATMSNWIFNFLVVKITPTAIANIGYQTYIIFTVFVIPLLDGIVDRRIYGSFLWSGSSSLRRQTCL